LSGAIAATLMASALAQAADTSDTDQGTLQQVIVTGSRIERSDTDAPAPVQVITSEQIANSGYTSISDVLHALTSNGQGNLNQSFNGAFAAGASGVSLRGLTVDATLVLIDGHRMANYPISDDGERSFVDVGNLPESVIDRVEVLKDGASAIYGSDAIAGVVNIILKKTFVGTDVSADAGTSYKHDGTTEHFSATYGVGDLAADGHNTYFNVAISRRSAWIRVRSTPVSITTTNTAPRRRSPSVWSNPEQPFHSPIRSRGWSANTTRPIRVSRSAFRIYRLVPIRLRVAPTCLAAVPTTRRPTIRCSRRPPTSTCCCVIRWTLARAGAA
jgi:iron complex outermembrane receptor protein